MPAPAAPRHETIEITAGFAGHLALPPGGSGPGLLLWPEIFGINEHIRGVAQQYALDGYAVLAPDVFWRSAPGVELGYEGDDRSRAMALMQAYKPAEVDADIAAAAAALRARAEVGGARVGAIGYCMGGRLAYLSAAAGVVDAAVAYYGGGIHKQLDRAAAVRCPMLMHFAGSDDNIPPEAVQAVRAALPGAELHVYEGAHHGFNCWARAAWDAPSAALARGRSGIFLARQLHGI